MGRIRRPDWMRVIAAVLIVALLAGFVAAPRARALLPGVDLAIILSVLNTLSEVLTSVEKTLSAILDFFNRIVYPSELIQRARALVQALQGIFASIRALLNLPVHSATLPAAQDLEAILLSRNASRIPEVPAAYARVYQAVPPPEQAPPEVRDHIDMSDAQAQAAMKRSLALDEIAEQTLNAADQIGAEMAVAAPGTAPMVEAAAVALLVRAHAHTQAAVAEMMRVRAVALAHEGAQGKINAQHAAEARRTFADVLRR